MQSCQTGVLFMIKMNCALSKWQKSLNLLRLCHIVLIFLSTGSLCFAQSLGEKLFKENNPKDAVQVLENEILNGQISANTYNFLGLGYYQIGEYEKSVDAFGRGIKEQPANAKILYFNQGNAYYALKQFEKAA